ncbi:MAG: hypothetical protein GXP58_02680 [Deltaproteobacteria bacterium]|nr:hypothetical protein [Deltaproteobacteria bacterium]
MIRFSRMSVVYVNDQGMALVTALLILLALTLIGMTAMINTTIDTKIAGNDYQNKKNLYAAEGCTELAASNIEAIISGTSLNINNTNYTFDSLNDLLEYDTVDGDITPVLNAYLSPQKEDILAEGEDINALCNPDDGESYTIHISNHGDGSFSLFSRYDDKRDMVRITFGTLLLNGAVNLINPGGAGDNTKRPPNVQIRIESSWEGKIKGKKTKDDTEIKIATTDSLPDIEDETSAVTSITHNYHPTREELDGFVNSLLRGREPDKAAKVIRIDNEHNLDLLLMGTADAPQVTYLQGNVKTENSVTGYGVLIIDDYNDGCESTAARLDANDNFNYHGLVILRHLDPKHHGVTRIKLSENAKIEGALIAYSDDQENGIEFIIKEHASIDYNPAMVSLLKKFYKKSWTLLN